MSRNKQPLDPESNLKLDFAEETYNIKTEYEEDVVDHLKGEQELDHVEQDFDPLTIKSFKKEVETVHEGKKLYPCQLCALVFSSRKDRGHHVLSVHEGYAYKCLLCDKVVTKTKKSLISHIITIHEVKEPKIDVDFIRGQFEIVSEQNGFVADSKKYPCLVCDKKLKNRRGQLGHMKDVHKKACQFCGSIFQTIQQKTKHIQGQSWQTVLFN